MKLAARIAVIFFFIGISTYGQSKFGVHVGLSSSDFEAVGGYQTSPNRGLYAGIYGSFDIGNHFFIQPELNYSFRGARRTMLEMPQDETPQPYVYDYEFHYIDLPILAKISFPFMGNKIQGYFLTGPLASFLIDKKLTVEKTHSDGVTEESIDDFKKFDLAWTGGFAIAMQIPTGFLTIGFRYNYSLIVSEEKYSGHPIRNQWATVLVGMEF